MKFSDENFVTIQGWMRTGLGLKGNDLLVYAAIYGFSQKEDQWFTGGQQYLAELCGSPERSIRRNLQNLEDLGLIEVTFSDQDARWNKYRTTDVREIEDNMSSNKIRDNMSSNEDNMSPIDSEIEDIPDKNRGHYVQNRGHNVRQNINKYKYNNINNLLQENKEKENKSSTTAACAREESDRAPELTEQDLKSLKELWNAQNCTQNIAGIHHMTTREANTRICIHLCGCLQNFVDEINGIDSQAFFVKKAEQNNLVKYDWFVNPDNFQKVIEGNYKEKRKSKEKESFEERLMKA